MYVKKQTFDNSPEFLVSEKYINFSKTAVNKGITADENGRKYMLAGSLIDTDGQLVTITKTGTSGSETYTPSGTVDGIVFHTVDVTEGSQPVAVMVEGYIIAERLQGENVSEYVKTAAFKAAFPKITVM